MLSRKPKVIRRKRAEETIKIIENGYYECNGHHELSPITTTIYLQSDILKRIKTQIAGDYIPLNNRFIREYANSGQYDTNIEIWNISSLGAANELYKLYPKDKICILNFASARNPGGGFLNGAQAQEESLVRSSTLYSSLSHAKSFYHVNEAAKSAVYTHNTIYSENVTILRHDSETEDLLEYPYIVDFITCPAVNRRLTENVKNSSVIDDIMIERTRILFAIANKHKVEHLVLGAWGCGVFRNDPWFIANMFLNLLTSEFYGTFKSVTFAILGDDVYKCFQEAFK